MSRPIHKDDHSYLVATRRKQAGIHHVTYVNADTPHEAAEQYSHVPEDGDTIIVMPIASITEFTRTNRWVVR